MSVANFLKTCPHHNNKVWHKTRTLAEAEARRLGHPDLDILPCEYSTNGEWFHLGGQSKKRSQLVNGEGSSLVFSSTTPEPLTFRPSVPSINDLTEPEALNHSNSIEWLLSAAEESGVVEAETMAGQIRDLLAKIVDEVRVGKERLALDAEIADLEAQIAALMAQLDDKRAARRELDGEPEPVAKPFNRAASLPPSADQGLIRAWARENGIEVKAHGQISLQVREAYEQAMGGTR